MKKIIITLIVIVGAGAIIAAILTGNKKANEEKIELVNQNTGAAFVQIESVTNKEMEIDYSVNGNLFANRELDLKSENPGVIASIKVKEGDRVGKGTLLAVLDDKFLSLNHQSSEDVYQKLLKDKERYESSFKSGGVTKAQLDEINLQLKNAETRLKESDRRNFDANIKAPIAGIINKKFIEEGAYINPGSSLFEIVDVATLKLKVSVDENQVSQLKIGDNVDVSIPVFPDKHFSGTISFIAPKADASLNFPVEIKLSNTSDAPIRAGMYATAVFNSQGSRKGIFIPRKAFVGSVNNKEVFVLESNNTVSLRKVTPGTIIRGNVEILGGLKEGEKIVTSGQINLTDGAKVEVQQ